MSPYKLAAIIYRVFSERSNERSRPYLGWSLQRAEDLAKLPAGIVNYLAKLFDFVLRRRRHRECCTVHELPRFCIIHIVKCVKMDSRGTEFPNSLRYRCRYLLARYLMGNLEPSEMEHSGSVLLDILSIMRDGRKDRTR